MSRIVYQQTDGTIAIIVPSGNVNDAIKDVPAATSYEIVEDSDIPTDRTFRNAWEHDVSLAPEKVKTDMPKAKVLGHDIRRNARNELFKPLDIEATIPAVSAAAEVSRQAIRDSDAIVQTDIDAAADEAALKLVLTNASYL